MAWWDVGAVKRIATAFWRLTGCSPISSLGPRPQSPSLCPVPSHSHLKLPFSRFCLSMLDALLLQVSSEYLHNAAWLMFALDRGKGHLQLVMKSGLRLRPRLRQRLKLKLANIGEGQMTTMTTIRKLVNTSPGAFIFARNTWEYRTKTSKSSTQCSSTILSPHPHPFLHPESSIDIKWQP